MWWSAIERVSRSKLAAKTRNIERIVCRWQNGRKCGQPARYICRQGKLSCDPRCDPGIFSPDIIGSYIFFETAGDGWQFAKVVGLAKDGERFSVHLRLYQPKMPDVSGDPGTWCWHLHSRGRCKHYTHSLS